MLHHKGWHDGLVLAGRLGWVKYVDEKISFLYSYHGDGLRVFPLLEIVGEMRSEALLDVRMQRQSVPVDFFGYADQPPPQVPLHFWTALARGDSHFVTYSSVFPHVLFFLVKSLLVRQRSIYYEVGNVYTTEIIAK